MAKGKDGPKLEPEAQEEVLRCIAARMPAKLIAEHIYQVYGVRVTPQNISNYKGRQCHQDEINRLREQMRSELKASGAHFVDKYERVIHYGMMASRELSLRRNEEAAKFMKMIAEEMGDLQQKFDVTSDGKQLGFDGPVDSASVNAAISGLLERLTKRVDPAGEDGAAGEAQEVG